MDENIQQQLISLFEDWSSQQVIAFIPLPQLGGSDRRYYRLASKTKTAIGVYNEDKKENDSFIAFTNHFSKKGLKVPKIYGYNKEECLYIQEDLGNQGLLSSLNENRKNGEFPERFVSIYKTIVRYLPKFQIEAAKDLDYSYCYPSSRFDKQSMLWDLNYFKYYFLKLAKVPFDERGLEEDFQRFSDYLLQADSDYFMYRDFQGRNIMLHNGSPYFIDYQGGRKGALQYDLASLLYQSKAAIPEDIRQELLDDYIDAAKEYTDINEVEFKEYFYGFVLIRIMQAMGAYGFRGFYERKEHFLKSIPFALKNMEWILDNVKLPVELPTLMPILRAVVNSEELKKFKDEKPKENRLKITVTSFSFIKGDIPRDADNGGGFVFDCRGLHNPGRYEPYKKITGRNNRVIQFFKKESRIDDFLQDVYTTVEPTVQTYIKRDFTHLMINFGCTGGQHRSVYCADELAKYLHKKYDVEVNLKHIEQHITEHFPRTSDAPSNQFKISKL